MRAYNIKGQGQIIQKVIPVWGWVVGESKIQFSGRDGIVFNEEIWFQGLPKG